jgi:hypothetical protein
MCPDHQQDVNVPLPAAPFTAVVRENEELKAANEVLAKKVVELQNLVAELRQAKEDDLISSQVSAVS